MQEVEIRFEREDQDGVVPVGTYLIDAAKRFGIRFEEACDPVADQHYCSVVVKTGAGLLSQDTKAEHDHFASRSRRTNERLACQAKIEKPGEVVVMTEKKKKTTAEETADAAAENDRNEQYRKEFADMPLEKKIANLVQLESIALGETVTFIINSPFKIADKVMDVMAEFGFKKEEEQRAAARPEEHKAKTNGKKKSKAKNESAE
jgi:ferredoxin